MKFETPHRRWNPLREEWVLNSPHRMKRPWQGKVEPVQTERRPAYDPKCYLCPGNKRAGGAENPTYESVFAFTNDFSALLPDEPSEKEIHAVHGVVLGRPERGICRVLCFSPRHDLTMADMDRSGILAVLRLWRDEYDSLARTGFIAHVMTFENKGEIMGCSNPHPHGQIWATSYVPSIPQREIDAQARYHSAHGSRLLQDYLGWETGQSDRIVCVNDDWAAIVPFWAVWPFELMILPRRAVATITELTEGELESWASILKDVLTRYDSLFQTSFPYSMGVYQHPTLGEPQPGFLLHQIFSASFAFGNCEKIHGRLRTVRRAST